MDKRIIEDFKSKLKVEKVLAALHVDYDVRGEHAWVNCVVHDEQTPSMHLRLEDGVYFCFGCSAAGGDMIKFVMDKERLGFVQAIELLSKLLGIPLPTGLDEIDKGGLVKRKLSSMRKAFVADDLRIDYTPVYEYLLSLCDSAAAEEYLESRGIQNPTWVGGSMCLRVLKDYEGINTKMLERFSHRQLMNSGIMTEKKNLVFLHHRLLMPFLDGDEIVYVSSRAMDNETKPKYLNLSGVTIPGLYNVGSVRAADIVFVCEGLTDTLGLVGVGVPAVGIAGAGNIDLEVLRAFEGKKVILAFDNDAAGEAGARKLREVLPYIADAVYEYKKPEKDMLEHLTVSNGPSKVRDFYKAVFEGREKPALVTATALYGPSTLGSAGQNTAL